MLPFPKIDTLFDRDERRRVIPTKVRRPEFLTVSGWMALEKIDGCNTRIQLTTDGQVNYSGRTDKSTLQREAVEMLQRTLPAEKMKLLWKDDKPPVEIVLFGESYGGKIQNGGLYRPDVGFRLFDAAIVEKRVWWQEWSTVVGMAHVLELLLVPMLDPMPVPNLVEMVRAGFNSYVASEDSEQARPAEGIVVRSVPILFNRKNERVIWKLKTRDFR